jgi:hypothetical protein
MAGISRLAIRQIGESLRYSEHTRIKTYIIAPLLLLFAIFVGFSAISLYKTLSVNAATRAQRTIKVPADKENCLECHTAKKKLQFTEISREKPSTYLSPELILKTAHGGLACTDCHKGYTRAVMRRSISQYGKVENKVLHSEQEYRNYTQVATEACGDPKCHKKEQEEFLSGSHSTRITKTDKDLPTCTTCHNFHYIPHLFTDSKGKTIKISAELKITVAVQLCGSCHVSDLDTYTGNYHYKALRLGNADAPMCYDCHDGHKSVRLSPGTKEAIVNCKKCHKNANKEFTQYVVHLDPVALTAPPEVLYTNLFYTSLVILVLVVVGLHTTIQWTRKRRERRLQELKEMEKYDREHPE